MKRSWHLVKEAVTEKKEDPGEPVQVHNGKAGSRKASVSSLVATDKNFKGLVYNKFGCLQAAWLEHEG